MATRFKPQIGDMCRDFCTRKSNQEQASLPKVIKEGMPKGGISSEKVARNFMLNHFKRIEEAFEIPADLRDKVIEAVIEADKKILIDNGFQNFIPKAEKTLRVYVATSEIPTDDEATPASTPANPVLEGTEDAPASDEAPATEGTANPEQPSDAPLPTDVMVDENADDDNDEPTAEDKPVNGKKTNWKKCIIFFVIGLLLGFVIAFAIKFAGGTANTAHNLFGNNTVVYQYKGYVLSDYGAKTTITVQRDNDKTVGHNVSMLMDSTIYTDEDGVQWLKYTSTTPDVAVEIIAPIFPEGEFSTKNWQKNVDKRNRQFGVVELMWNGDQCTLVLSNADEVYKLLVQ